MRLCWQIQINCIFFFTNKALFYSQGYIGIVESASCRIKSLFFCPSITSHTFRHFTSIFRVVKGTSGFKSAWLKLWWLFWWRNLFEKICCFAYGELSYPTLPSKYKKIVGLILNLFCYLAYTIYMYCVCLENINKIAHSFTLVHM